MENIVPKKVFLDNCIVSISDTVQGAQKSTKVSWGGKEHTIQVSGFEGKPLPRDDEVWKREQIECMPTIGRLARQNVIALSIYVEIQFEGWKRPRSFPATAIGNVFNGIEFEYVDAAVERSYFFQSSLDDYIDNQRMIDFCKWLLKINPDILIEKIMKARDFPDFLLINLRNVERFRELCKGLSEKQYPDAFHLWTAEVNGADCFLTIDKKFIRVMTETNKAKMPCPPLSPSQLLDELGIHERDPIEYVEGAFYDIFGRRS